MLFLVRSATVLEVGLVTVTIATAAGAVWAEGAAGLTPVLSTSCAATLGRGMGHSHLHATVHQPAAPSRPAWAAGHPRPAWCDGGLFRPPRRCTTCLGLAFVLTARLGDPVLPLILTTAILLLSVRSLIRSGRMWRTPGSGPAWWRRSAAASHPVLGKRETGLRAKGTVLVIG